MKKYIYVGLILFTLFLALTIQNVYAEYGNINSSVNDDILKECIPGGDLNQDFLKEYFRKLTGTTDQFVTFSRSGNQDKMTVRLKITKVEKDSKIYYQVGEENGICHPFLWPKPVDASNLSSNGFLDKSSNNVGDSWYIWVDLLFSDTPNQRVSFLRTFSDSEDLDLYAEAWEGLKKQEEAADGGGIGDEDGEDGLTDEEMEANKQKIKDFILHPLATLVWLVGELFRGLGDVGQKVAEYVVSDNSKLAYTYDELKENSDLDNYTKVGKYSTNIGEGIINLPKTNTKKATEKRFTSDSKIPIVKVDIYNLAADTISIFDINFLKVDAYKHNGVGRDGIWKNIRNVIVVIVRGVIYITAALLIVLLILDGIKIITGAGDNPEKQKKNKDALNKFATSFAMLIGSVIIMAVCIYGGNMLFGSIKEDAQDELPIRVNSGDADYSFSTNFTGFLRYMASIEGVSRSLEKLGYAFGYCIVGWINGIISVVMLARMFVMMMLAVVGPILAALNALNISNNVKMKYSTWVVAYVLGASIQLLYVIVYKIIYSLV